MVPFSRLALAALTIGSSVSTSGAADNGDRSGGEAQRAAPASPLRVENGWYVWHGRVLWGNAQHNGWWRPGQRPNLTRNAPGEVGPNRTEDLDKLTDNMLRYGYPGFEHNFGLWYDRRRDRHDTTRRPDANVVSPFLEQPWARSDKGVAWDGRPKYDLLAFNAWYFKRLRSFAELCDRKGTILLYNFYMQHALLETNAHYVDFPWRPTNCLQDTGMPDGNPAANVFYDVSHPARRRLHKAYIRKCLDELGSNSNVLFLISEEFTGSRSFVEFWLDTISAWERETGRDVHVVLSGCKDVLDAVLADPKRTDGISTIDLRYWWYRPDGSLFAPASGTEVPGRYVTKGASATTPEQIYRQVIEYRRRYPDKGLLHQMEATRQQTWAFLLGGGSLLIRYLTYPGEQDPPEYIAPEHAKLIRPAYDFIRTRLATALPRMTPRRMVLDHPERNWCLADSGSTYLVYALKGGRFRVDLTDARGELAAKWLDPRSGELREVSGGAVEGGAPATFTAPDEQDWALWLSKAETPPN